MARVTVAVAITAACGIMVARMVDPGRVLAVLGDAAPSPLALAGVLALGLPFWRGARLAQLLPIGGRPRRGTLTAIAAEALLWSFLLPFKLGELSFPWLLHRRAGLPLAEAAGTFVLVRVTDLLTIAGLTLVGAAVAGLGLGLGLPWWAFAVAGGMLLAAPLALVVGAGRAPRAAPSRPRGLAAVAAGAAHARTGAARARFFATTLAVWSTHVAIAWLALRAVGADVGVAAAAVASGAGNLAFALPVSGVLGLGPQQMAFAVAAEAGGVERVTAAAAAIAAYAVVVAAAVTAGVVARVGFGAGVGETAGEGDRQGLAHFRQK